jgi:hypothetical protein
MYQNKVTKAFTNNWDKRKNHPLTRGIYKLSEAQGELEQLSNGVKNIYKYRLKKISYLHSPCCPNEISLWLKNMPIYISENFGYNVVPALSALRGDGLSDSEFKNMKRRYGPLIYEYIDECARFHEALKHSIRFETSSWHFGESRLQYLTDKGIELIQEIMQDSLHRSNV